MTRLGGRYWAHVPIDRFTAQLLDKQIEVVNSKPLRGGPPQRCNRPKQKIPARGKGPERFVVEGEPRYRVHVAIDRFTGKVIDKQIEAVNE